MAPPQGRQLLSAAVVIGLALAPACSIRKMAIQNLGDALAESGHTYSRDDDPELVREALPFALKLMESLLDESPEHAGLLEAAASGFTQYAWAFVHQDSEAAADHDLEEADRLKGRARRLYARALGYGLRSLEVHHPGLREALGGWSEARQVALDALDPDDLEALYWTATSWGLLISVSKDDPIRLSELSRVEALLDRALELDEAWGEGALHEAMIFFEGGRSDAMGGSVERATTHYLRAVELSSGLRASPFVTYAETVSVRNQNRSEFVETLGKALEVDPDALPESRLLNLVMQRRARWLLERIDRLFLD